MGWILLESFVALLLALFIVWWTMGGTRKRDVRTDRSSDRDGRESER